MALRLKDVGEVPSEQWRFPISQTGFIVFAPNWFALYPKIKQHCEANSIQPPSEQEVVDWCCNNLSLSCYDETTREPLMNRWAQGLPSGIAPPSCCNRK